MSPIVSGSGLLLAIFSFVGIAVLFWFGLRRPPVRRPSCGSCGYAVEGLEALSCPECGSDLREVGIETPKRRMLHPGLFILLWSLLLVIPSITVFTMAMRMGPRVVVSNATFGLVSTSGSMPQLLVDQRLEGLATGPGVSVTSATESTIERDGRTTSVIQFPKMGRATLRRWTVDVRTAADAVQMNAPKLTFKSDDAARPTIDAESLAVLFGDAPLESAEDGAEVAALLDALVSGDPSYTGTRLRIAGGNTVRSTSRTVGWLAPVLIAIGAAVYGLGIVVYLVIRRRRLGRG